MAVAKQATGSTWFEKQLAKAVQTTKRLGDLKTGIDSRVNGTISGQYVDEIVARHQSSSEFKYPVYVTKDGYFLTLRHGARALGILMAKEAGNGAQPEDMMIPVIEVPITYGKLDNSNLTPEQQNEVLAFVAHADMPTDNRTPLNKADIQEVILKMAENGATLAEIVTLMTTPALKKWRIEEFYRNAQQTITNKKIAAARIEVKTLVKAGRSVDYQKLAVKFGLPVEKATVIAAPPGTNQDKPLAIRRLWKRQGRTQSAQDAAKVYADSNLTAYRESQAGLRDGKRVMTEDRLVEITTKHLNAARRTVKLWEEALGRAEAEVARNNKN